MQNHYDVIVAGVGTMGSAACYHLARRGIKVLGLEQYSLAHRLGAHHGESRVIRLAFYSNAEYIPLLRRAYALWDALERDSDCGLFQITGGVFMGPPESTLIERAIGVSRAQEIPYEMWDKQQLFARFPQFGNTEGLQAFFDPQAGYLRPERVVAAHAELSTRLGAEIRCEEPVVRWQANQSVVTVQTTRGTYEAAQLILAGGAWTDHLLTELQLPLTVTRQVLAWFRPPTPQSFSPQQFPVWFVETEPGCGYYGFPTMPGQRDIKIALDKPGQVTNPEEIDRDVSPSEVDDLHRFLSKHIPAAAGEFSSAGVCQYTNSPDRHFLIDRHPAHDRVKFACGFSGHGFKFSSAVGEALAEWIASGHSPRSLDFFRLSRLDS